MSLLKKLLSKFVQPLIIAEVGSNDLISINFQTKANQVDDDKLIIGFTTRQLRLMKVADHGLQWKNSTLQYENFLSVPLSIC